MIILMDSIVHGMHGKIAGAVEQPLVNINRKSMTTLLSPFSVTYPSESILAKNKILFS